MHATEGKKDNAGKEVAATHECITAAEFEARKKAAQAQALAQSQAPVHVHKRLLEYTVRVVFASDVGCERAQKLVRVAMQAVARALGAPEEDVYVQGSSCKPPLAAGDAAARNVSSRGLTTTMLQSADIRAVMSVSAESDTDATSATSSVSVGAKQVQGEMVAAGVPLGSQIDMYSKNITDTGAGTVGVRTSGGDGRSGDVSLSEVASLSMMIGICVPAVIVVLAVCMLFARRAVNNKFNKLSDEGVQGQLELPTKQGEGPKASTRSRLWARVRLSFRAHTNPLQGDTPGVEIPKVLEVVDEL